MKLRDLQQGAGTARVWPPQWEESSGPGHTSTVAEEGVLKGLQRLGNRLSRLSRIRIAWPPLLGASAKSSAATRLPRRVYFLSAAFFSAGALDADFAIDVVGTMMCAYGVPFHITHGPPLVQSVGYASS